MMYSTIFTDIHIDDRRMRKHADDAIDEVAAQEVVIVIDIDEREVQEISRPLPERDRPEVREPRERDERRDDYFLRQYHGGGW